VGGSGESPQPLLEVRGLDVAYGTVQVLFGIDLAIERGETVALLGTNGAGKSTLLKAISGLLPPASGSIHFQGADLSAAPPHERVRAGLVQLSGGTSVFPGLSVAENLRIGAFTFLDDERRVSERIDYALALFPALKARLGQRAGSMSGGEQQMIALAKALIPEPELLIIDELSLGLAPVVVELLLGVLDELKTDGMTMLIVEQSLNVAIAFAERAMFMERGEIRFSGPAQELLEAGDLVRAVFLGSGS
jgi:ABC-type branched-subunit amino acid transport system ATPase component